MQAYLVKAAWNVKQQELKGEKWNKYYFMPANADKYALTPTCPVQQPALPIQPGSPHPQQHTSNVQFPIKVMVRLWHWSFSDGQSMLQTYQLVSSCC